MPVKLRTCVHCNTTFTSAVSLSNHLRAYARKKSAGLLTGTGMFEQITQQVCLIQYTFFLTRLVLIQMIFITFFGKQQLSLNTHETSATCKLLGIILSKLFFFIWLLLIWGKKQQMCGTFEPTLIFFKYNLFYF